MRCLEAFHQLNMGHPHTAPAYHCCQQLMNASGNRVLCSLFFDTLSILEFSQWGVSMCLSKKCLYYSRNNSTSLSGCNHREVAHLGTPLQWLLDGYSSRYHLCTCKLVRDQKKYCLVPAAVSNLVHLMDCWRERSPLCDYIQHEPCRCLLNHRT